jgi:transporter family-2 protein
MNKIFWILTAFIAGAILPIQAGLNTKLGKAAENPVYAALFSFIVGTIVLGAYVLATRQPLSVEGIKNAPSYLWVGGILGAFYVTVIVLIFPKLGPGLSFGLIVAGQMLASLFLEHYHILVAQQNSISLAKITGVGLIILGVILLRK